MRLSFIKTSAIVFAIAGSLIQLTSAQTIVGGDPGTWGTPMTHQERIVGADPITWGPPNDYNREGGLIVGGDRTTWGTPELHHGRIVGNDPSTWGPPNDYHHDGYYYEDFYRDGMYPPVPVPHHGGLDQYPPVPVPHHGGLNDYQPKGQHGLIPGHGETSFPHYGDGR